MIGKIFVLCLVAIFLQAETLYVGHLEEGYLSFMERESEETDGFLSLQSFLPEKILFRKAANELYVQLKDSSYVYVVDCLEKTVKSRLDLQEKVCDACLQEPYLFATSPSYFLIFDLREQKFLTKMPHNLKGALRLAINLEGDLAFITGDGGMLQTVNLTSKQMSDAVSLNPGNLGAICPGPHENEMVIASSSYDYDLLVWNYRKKTVRKLCSLINVVEGGNQILISPDGKYLYVLGEKTANVGRFDWEKQVWDRSLPVSLGASSFTITKDGSHLYVGSSIQKSLDSISLDTFNTVREILFPYPPCAVLVEPCHPVQNLSVRQIEQQFLSGKERRNILEWETLAGAKVAYYLVRKNGQLLRKLAPEDKMFLEDGRIQKGEKAVYEVVAVSASGTHSQGYQTIVP
ncbi:MAG: WD40 repeat domain-containing protein [Chlamydiota bacterium]